MDIQSKYLDNRTFAVYTPKHCSKTSYMIHSVQVVYPKNKSAIQAPHAIQAACRFPILPSPKNNQEKRSSDIQNLKSWT